MSEYQEARQKYDYVPAHLKQPSASEPSTGYFVSFPIHQVEIVDWYSSASVRRNYSSLALDNYHAQLLSSDSDHDLLLGLLSVVYWGFAAGTDRKTRYKRALSRCKAIVEGRTNSLPQPVHEVISHLKRARELLDANKPAEALLECCRIKFLHMAFASKVLAFMRPEAATVYDDVISLRLKDSQHDQLKRMYVSTAIPTSKQKRMDQSIIYEKWCLWCANEAFRLNAANKGWQDWNGDVHPWRALDVERAFFSLGRGVARSAKS